MTDFSREKMLSIRKRQDNYVAITFAVQTILTVAVTILSVVIFDGAAGLLVLFGGLIILNLGMMMLRRKIIPKGNGKIVMKAMQYLSNDFISDSAVNKLYELIGKADSFDDKTSLILLLSDLYTIRGQHSEAIGMLNSIDRQRLAHSPEIGIKYYGQVIGTYSDLGDSASVLAAFADAEPFIDECAERSYLCYMSTITIMSQVEKARKNYRRALDLRLLRNECENNINTMSSNMGTNTIETPLKRFVRGSIFLETAELFYLCGDYQNAGKYLDIGGPLLSASRHMTDNANKLSAKIREAIKE